MDRGATGTEHLPGTINDSAASGCRPAVLPSGSRCGVDRAAQSEEDPAGLRDDGLAVCAAGGRPFGVHQPSTRAMCQARFWVLAAVGEVLMATAHSPGDF